ncbi:MAG: D-alanyl-D-alanine dipeptidase [Rhizobacter sp.]|nr:D-alanyl-D-alanine dipeptidase [Chlorobiales bacterium]
MIKTAMFIFTIISELTVSTSSQDAAKLVEVQKLNPRIKTDLRYATANNFMKKAVYPANARCVLIKSVAERLVRVQERLEKQGYGLKIYDAYRPLSAQWELWKVTPNENFVANPKKGSKHNRGSAVDLTVVDKDGNELEMPTLYDAFVKEARSDYQNLPAKVLAHRKILHDAMKAEGFIPNSSEWWHFDAPDWKNYPVLDVPFDAVP